MNLYQEIRRFYTNFRGEKQILGRSAEGRRIFAVFVGSHKDGVGICQYAMHAREWITALLALEHVQRGVPRGGVWFVPLVNPDGAALATGGTGRVLSEERKRFLTALNGGEDFSLWKANAEGVDLNVNFPAGWGEGKSNVFSPASANFVGERPLCAPESRALAAFTRKVRPRFTMSWHTKGEEIYWKFRQPPERAERDLKEAERLSAILGYPLKETPNSAGGYKDWCVEALKIPAFTVEAGSDSLSHPLGLSELPTLVERCGNAVKEFTEGFSWKNGL